MTAPEFVEEKTVSLVDAKKLLEKVEKRDLELNYRSNKTKEFLDIFFYFDTLYFLYIII